MVFVYICIQVIALTQRTGNQKNEAVGCMGSLSVKRFDGNDRVCGRHHIELMEILLTNRRNEVGLASTLS